MRCFPSREMEKSVLFMLSVVTTHAVNLDSNKLVSIPVDLGKGVPDYVLMRYLPYEGSNVYEIFYNDTKHVKIGDVLENGVLIYADSPSLVRRSVMNMVSVPFPGTLVKINSVYRTKGADVREITEFIRNPGEWSFREVVRRPYELNLKPGSRNSTDILVINIEGTGCFRYDIRTNKKHEYMIGVVRYGDVVVDSYIVTVIHKSVTTYKDGSGKIIVEINKMNKAGDYICSKYMIEWDEGLETGSCREIDFKIQPFW